MIRSIIVFLFSITLLISCKSSYSKIGDKEANFIPYYLKVYEADSLYYACNYTKYKTELEDLFQKYEPINMSSYFEYEKYVKTLIIIDNDKKYKKELENLISNFGYKKDDLLKDSIFSIAFNNNSFDLNYIKQLEKKYETRLDSDFIKELKIIEFNDQEVRNRQGITLKERNPLMKEVDKINDSIIKNYILRNGFPSHKVIGRFSLDILFNHFSYNGSYDFYKESLPKFIKEGTCNPRIYSSLIDRWFLMNKGELFYYISWSDRLKLINDTKKIDQINFERRKIGLPSINQEKKLLERLNKVPKFK